MNTLHQQRLAFCLLHSLTFGWLLKLVTLFFFFFLSRGGKERFYLPASRHGFFCKLTPGFCRRARQEKVSRLRPDKLAEPISPGAQIALCISVMLYHQLG